MLTRRVSLECLLLASVVLLLTITAAAQNLAAARILSSDGPVEIERRGAGQATAVKIAYRVNDEVRAGDVIKTFKRGRLVLGLMDGSQAIIGEQTTVEVLDLAKSPRTIFNLLRGKTRIKIEKVGGRPNPYRVNTPTAVIAVRGTLFDVLVAKNETQVFVHEGQVAVSSLSAPEAPVLLAPGQRTRVQQAQPPEPPAPFQPGRNDELFNPHAADRGQNDHARGPNGALRGAHGPLGPAGGLPGSEPNGGKPEHDGSRDGHGKPPAAQLMPAVDELWP